MRFINTHFTWSDMGIYYLYYFTGKKNEKIEEKAAATLFITLKDHNCQEAVSLTRTSQRSVISEVALSEGHPLHEVALTDGEDFSSHPVQFIITQRIDESVKEELVFGITKVEETGINLKLITSEGKIHNLLHITCSYHVIFKYVPRSL